MEFKSKYGIGDAVYKVSAYSVEKDLIKVIKFTKPNKCTYSFGPPTGSYSVLDFFGRQEAWYEEDELFDDQLQAEARHEALKLKRQQEELQNKEKARKQRIIEAKAELEAAENDIELDREDY